MTPWATIGETITLSHEMLCRPLIKIPQSFIRGSPLRADLGNCKPSFPNTSPAKKGKGVLPSEQPGVRESQIRGPNKWFVSSWRPFSTSPKGAPPKKRRTRPTFSKGSSRGSARYCASTALTWRRWPSSLRPLLTCTTCVCAS